MQPTLDQLIAEFKQQHPTSKLPKALRPKKPTMLPVHAPTTRLKRRVLKARARYYAAMVREAEQRLSQHA